MSLQPTKSETLNNETREANVEIWEAHKWEKYFAEKQRARRISGMTTYSKEDLEIKQ